MSARNRPMSPVPPEALHTAPRKLATHWEIHALNTQGLPIVLRFERRVHPLPGVAIFVTLGKTLGPVSVALV